VRESGGLPCAILGVTNPYFDKALARWPTRLRLDTDGGPSGRGARMGGVGAPVSAPDRRKQLMSSPVRSKSIESSVGMGGGSAPQRAYSGAATGGGGTAFHSSVKQALDHDRAFMKKLLSAASAPEEASRLLRQHFWSLTQQFLIPLESFAARLMPLKRSINPFQRVPNLGTFKPDEFIAWLRSGLPPALQTRKGNWLLLYKCVITSCLFATAG
jgi:hypothetical protein